MNTVVDIASSEALIADAYARVKADLAALKPDELVRVNLDVPLAEATILGVLPELGSDSEGAADVQRRRVRQAGGLRVGAQSHASRVADGERAAG